LIVQRGLARGHLTRGSARTFIRHLVILRLAVVCAAAAMAAPSGARAQVAVVVNSDVITHDDIERRAKFNTLVMHKNQPRDEIIEELIDDRLKVQVARRYDFRFTDENVDTLCENRAKAMQISPEQLTQLLDQSGIGARTFKAKLLADMSWQYLIRGRFDHTRETKRDGASGEVGYNYALRPILFPAPKGNTALLEARRKDADALRARFVNCDSGLKLARSVPNVVIRDTVTKNSLDLALPLREILDKTGLGHLTPLETTEQGIQVFAVCEKKETKSETFEKNVLELEKRFEARSKAYLRGLRRIVTIERKL
jgi:peptidyl-prolyl cis-trans isomerase SurA